jgi:hypothetical protein
MYIIIIINPFVTCNYCNPEKMVEFDSYYVEYTKTPFNCKFQIPAQRSGVLKDLLSPHSFPYFLPSPQILSCAANTCTGYLDSRFQYCEYQWILVVIETKGYITPNSVFFVKERLIFDLFFSISRINKLLSWKLFFQLMLLKPTPLFSHLFTNLFPCRCYC